MTTGDKKNTKAELKEMLRFGRVTKIFDALFAAAADLGYTELENDLIKLNNRFNRNEKNKINDVTSEESYSNEFNGIIDALLTHINSLPDSYHQGTPDEKASGSREEQSLRNQLNTLIKDLIDTNGQIYDLELTPANERKLNYYRKSSYFTEKQKFFAKQASWIMEQIPSLVSDSEYNLVARALYSSYDWFNAEKYCKIAIEASKEEFNMIANIRSYADFLYLTGRSEEGAEQYKNALQILPSNNDYNRSVNGYTYMMWFNNEAFAENTDPAISKYQKAKQEFESISNTRVRLNWLNNLDMEWERLMPPHIIRP